MRPQRRAFPSIGRSLSGSSLFDGKGAIGVAYLQGGEAREARSVAEERFGATECLIDTGNAGLGEEDDLESVACSGKR